MGEKKRDVRAGKDTEDPGQKPVPGIDRLLNVWEIVPVRLAGSAQRRVELWQNGSDRPLCIRLCLGHHSQTVLLVTQRRCPRFSSPAVLHGAPGQANDTEEQ